jgi:N utilization substance protein B
MRKRSRAREFAMQVLYQADITHDACAGILSNFWQSQAEEDIEESIRAFANDLVEGVIQNLEQIDAEISRYATNWQLDRMAVIDRNILRMGSYELLFRSDIPPKVSINEAVDLAKRYSGQEAGKFVNAILDKIKSEKKK